MIPEDKIPKFSVWPMISATFLTSLQRCFHSILPIPHTLSQQIHSCVKCLWPTVIRILKDIRPFRSQDSNLPARME